MISRAEMRRLLLLLAAICMLSRTADASVRDLTEIYRIRIVNEVDGPVQVSLDQGKSYATLGRVNRPATTCIQGFAASAYARNGTVAATAVHAIRVKAGSIGKDIPQVFSIIPKEFAVRGGSFGTGEVAGGSGIYTDIPAGTAIFRNLSPYVGNPVFVQTGRTLRALPPDYKPSPRDTLVIVVEEHDRRPTEIIIENRRGGRVDAVYGDGREMIATVEYPVRGIGRFDATEYTGVGAINTNHPGVVTVSTAPLPGPLDSSEPRGGFQILPSKHARRIGRIPQYMVVAPVADDSPPLEGAPVLFSEYIGLAHDPSTPSRSFLVDARMGGTEWRPLPALVGKKDDALAAVSHFRLRFPERSAESLERHVRASVEAYLRSKYGKKPPSTGILTFSLPNADLEGARFASLYVNQEFKGISSTPPFSFSIDSGKLPPGEHCVEIRGSNEAGVVVRSTKQWFYTVQDTAKGS